MGLTTNGPAFPQNRRVWDITQNAAGTQGASDIDFSEAPAQVGLADILFGVLLAQGSNGVTNIGPASDAVIGASVQGTPQSASNFENRGYKTGDQVATIRRGYLMIRIDPANKPTARQAFRVSFAAGKEGWLTSSSTSSLAIDEFSGLEITRVFDDLAEVYFPGMGKYEITGS